MVAKFNLPKDTQQCTFEIPKGTQGQTTVYKTLEN